MAVSILLSGAAHCKQQEDLPERKRVRKRRPRIGRENERDCPL